MTRYLPAILISIAVAVTSIASSAVADEAPLIDKDGDGSVSKAELLDFLHSQFAKIDANHDGSISEQELDAYAEGVFAKLDTDKDGKVGFFEAHGRIKSAMAQ